ncbi:MAG TPA: hypothetical protein VGG91_18765, partial [Myxococcaceae bacterium]
MSTPRTGSRRPFLRALAVSLLVHALLVAWLVRNVQPSRVPPPLRPATRVTLRPLPPRPAVPQRP